ncbi:hypothetical protein O7626_40220 [Micromonospora sp. WMMD1102]|uniref:hypothetical protein n=1 Tax=Micromonospora sp. WMMD1102 TaxID=3016105 RepID=UPI00241563E1|nr:hypothetical protein [Micromonospora sp. WMMD1102]MDG4792044.1 hypothetical protein [Micromonospora sp. WMMD1102]
MTSIQITPTRAAILHAIASTDIEVYALKTIRQSWADADVWLKESDAPKRKVTGIVADLEKAGLVRRQPPHTTYGMVRHYTLTDDGREAIGQ